MKYGQTRAYFIENKEELLEQLRSFPEERHSRRQLFELYPENGKTTETCKMCLQGVVIQSAGWRLEPYPAVSDYNKVAGYTFDNRRIYEEKGIKRLAFEPGDFLNLGYMPGVMIKTIVEHDVELKHIIMQDRLRPMLNQVYSKKDLSEYSRLYDDLMDILKTRINAALDRMAEVEYPSMLELNEITGVIAKQIIEAARLSERNEYILGKEISLNFFNDRSLYTFKQLANIIDKAWSQPEILSNIVEGE